ncbi:MAG: hypothetical protein GY941_22785 [Planctomycetes bacterium]|nr:hypothetical protein [Planctomycetota bacterium]
MQTNNSLIRSMLIIAPIVMLSFGCIPIKTGVSETEKAHKVPKKSHSTKRASLTKKSHSPIDSPKLLISGIINKPIVLNGKPEGPFQAVIQAHSGSMAAVQKELALSSEGRPETGTVAIAKPYKADEKTILLSLEKLELSGSNYEGRELVIELDERDNKGLFGEGAIYLIQPGVRKLRLGNYYVSTSGLRNWSSVQMAGPSTPPKILDNNVRVWSVSGSY